MEDRMRDEGVGRINSVLGAGSDIGYAPFLLLSIWGTCPKTLEIKPLNIYRPCWTTALRATTPQLWCFHEPLKKTV